MICLLLLSFLEGKVSDFGNMAKIEITGGEKVTSQLGTLFNLFRHSFLFTFIHKPVFFFQAA
jgi:hypothetical protein